MKYCTKCGNQVSESDKFCPDCGYSTGNSSNNETIKADLKVELTNTSTDKAFKAVGSSISSGKKAVKKGTKATTSFISKLIFPVLILGAIIGMFAYTDYLEKEEERELRVKNNKYFNLMCYVKQNEFKENILSEKEMCVYTKYRSNQGQMANPWEQTKLDCNLTFTELNKYQDWYQKGMSCSEFVDVYDK